MTSELIERVAGAISETRTGNSLSWRHYVVEAQAAIAAMQADAAPVAWQRRLKYPQAPGAIPQWEECSLNEAVGHFEKQPGYEYRPLYAHPPVAGREAVRAEQAAEIERLTLTVRKLQGHQAALESYLREIRDKPVARSSDAWKRHCLKLQAIAAEALGDVA